MRKAIQGLVLATVLSSAGAAAFADVYSDGNLTVDWTSQNNTLTGKIALGEQQFPTTAHQAGDDIDGEFQSAGAIFKYTAKLQNETLMLSSGGKTYTLHRKDAPANPLAGAGGAASSPAVTEAVHTDAAAPAGYSVQQKTNAGEALLATKPTAASVPEALSALIPDLNRLLDAPATIASAVEDEKSHGSGFLNFTGTKNGHAIRGVASCQIDNANTRIKIVYCDTSAPPEEWQKLNAEQNAVTDAAAKIAMRDVPMPDGTGSAGVPDGWNVKATSMLDPLQFDGPDGAKVVINGSFLVNTPNCQMVQMHNQMEQWSRQRHTPPPPPLMGIFADFASPSDSMKVLVPQFNKLAQTNHGPTIESDKIISVVPTKPQLPNGQAQLMEDTAYWISPDGTRTLMHGIGRFESSMIGNDAWMMQITSMVAPDDQFAKLQPAMLAILNGGKVNQEQCNRISQQRNEQQRQQIVQNGEDIRARQNAQFEAGQARHREQMASYDRYNHNWAVNENLKSRSNDNFIEYIGGTRDVLDTRTGQRQTYDLNDANAVASGLNDAAADPGRFKAIPLRDLKDPLMAR